MVEVEGVTEEFVVEGIWTAEAAVLRFDVSRAFGLVKVACFDAVGFVSMIGEVEDLPTRGELGKVEEEPDAEGDAWV